MSETGGVAGHRPGTQPLPRQQEPAAEPGRPTPSEAPADEQARPRAGDQAELATSAEGAFRAAAAAAARDELFELDEEGGVPPSPFGGSGPVVRDLTGHSPGLVAEVPGKPGEFDYLRNGVRIRIKLDAPAQQRPVMMQLAGHLDKLPQQLLEVNRVINIHSGPSPGDEFWRMALSDPDFVTAATGGGGQMDFYNNFMEEGVVFHEAAHNYADRHFGNPDPRRTTSGNQNGLAWDAAVQADGAYPSPYGKTVRDQTDSDGEDFAEATRVFIQAQRSGPEALNAFRQQFPHRAAILERLFPAA